jgi:hypothetical protein
MFIKFATGDERSNGEYILADGAIAFAWPCTGQLCTSIVERLQPVARAVSTDVGPPIDPRRGGPRPPDRRHHVEKPVRCMSGVNVGDDAIFPAAALRGREDDRAAFAFAFDAFRQALDDATDGTFSRPEEKEVEAAGRCHVGAGWRNTVLRHQGLPCCDAVVCVWRGGIDIDREHASPAAHGHSDQRVRMLAEVPTHYREIDRRAVHSMRVERLFLPDRAYGKHWNAGLRERQRSVEDRSIERGCGKRLSPTGGIGRDRKWRARVPIGLSGFARRGLVFSRYALRNVWGLSA